MTPRIYTGASQLLGLGKLTTEEVTVKYYIATIRNGVIPADSMGLKRYHRKNRLGDYKAPLLDGCEFVVYRGLKNLQLEKPYAFYRSKGGKLKRDKYRTSITLIREMFKEVA
jgi:hypothetical protein